MGFAQKSGLEGFCGSGGKRSMSLKSIVFSEGGFHFRLSERMSRVSYAMRKTDKKSAAGRIIGDDVHLGVGTNYVRRLKGSVYQPVVAVLQLGDVFVKNFLDTI